MIHFSRHLQFFAFWRHCGMEEWNETAALDRLLILHCFRHFDALFDALFDARFDAFACFC
jgi:hypothetical protein